MEHKHNHDDAPNPPQEGLQESLLRARRIAELALETKASKLQLYHVGFAGAALTDYMLVCSGRSQAHLRGIADKIMLTLKHDEHCYCNSIEGYREGSWIVLDYASVIVHLFHPETRTYYDLDSLYGVFPPVPLPGIQERG